MRRLLVGATLVLIATATSARTQGHTTPGAIERVTKSLTESDPLAEGSTSDLLTPDRDTDMAIGRVSIDDSAPTVARDRALRLQIAFNRVARIREAASVNPRGVVWWLSLDELDRELPRGPRETLLARALPDAAERKARLEKLAAAREVAERFCREWNELERNADQTKKYADLRAELERAGNAAIPYLATLLAVPPQATFTNIHEERGLTARQQVRALFALGFLDAKGCSLFALFHVRGPSFTQSATARSVLAQLTDIELPIGGEEAAQLAVIDKLWSSPRWGASYERDHLVRHTLRWARDGIESGDAKREYWAQYGPSQLQYIVGDVEFDSEAPLETRKAQLVALDQKAMRHCPVCVR